MSSDPHIPGKGVKKNLKFNIIQVLQSCFNKLHGQLMLNVRVDEVPESTFKSLSNKPKMSVLSSRNQHFRY